MVCESAAVAVLLMHLLPVHIVVGFFEYPIDRSAFGIGRPAERQAQRQVRGFIIVVGDGFFIPLVEGLHFLFGGIEQDDREFVAADAGDKIGLRDIDFQDGCRSSQ